MTDPNGGVTGFQYDDVDRLEQRVLPNGVVTSYSYDSRDRVLSVVHRNASNVVLASVVYERRASGEPMKITREDDTYVEIEYDAANRVSKESEHDANGVLVAETSYGYDHDGNRTSKTTLSGSQSYSYAAGFKLTGSTGVDGAETYTTDAGGRVTGIDRGGVQRTIEYDAFDHVTKVLDGGIEAERYTFDGEGRRVSADSGTSVRKFLVAPNLGEGFESPQAVTDANGNLIAAYVFSGIDSPFMKIAADGSVEYMLTDAMTSVIGKSDADGDSTATIRYDAFGSVVGGSDTGIDAAVGFEHRLHGMSLDAATGLYFVRARSYDARTGRFVSRDPVAGTVGRPETIAPYVFAHGAATIWLDPTGEFTLMDITTAFVVFTVAALITTSVSSGLLLKRTLSAKRFADGMRSYGDGIYWASQQGIRLSGGYGEEERARAEQGQAKVACLTKWIQEQPSNAYAIFRAYAGLFPDQLAGRALASFGGDAAFLALLPSPAGAIAGTSAYGVSFYGVAAHYAYQGVTGAALLGAAINGGVPLSALPGGATQSQQHEALQAIEDAEQLYEATKDVPAMQDAISALNSLDNTCR